MDHPIRLSQLNERSHLMGSFAKNGAFTQNRISLTLKYRVWSKCKFLKFYPFETLFLLGKCSFIISKIKKTQIQMEGQ